MARSVLLPTGMGTNTLASLAVLALVACGADGRSSDPLTPAENRVQCEQLCEHELACDPDVLRDLCLGACTWEHAGFFWTWMRGDVAMELYECLIERPCEVRLSEYSCPDTAQPLPEHDEYDTLCRARQGECTLTGGEFPCAEQSYFLAIPPAVVEELIDCLDQPCELVAPCLSAVRQAHGIPQ